IRKRPVCSTQSSMNGSRSACSASTSERYAPSTMRQYSRTEQIIERESFSGLKPSGRAIRYCKLYHRTFLQPSSTEPQNGLGPQSLATQRSAAESSYSRRRALLGRVLDFRNLSTSQLLIEDLTQTIEV